MNRILPFLVILVCAGASAGPPSTGDPFFQTIRVPHEGWYTFRMSRHMWIHAHGEMSAFDSSGKELSCGVFPHRVPSPFEDSAQPELLDYSQDAARAVLTLKIPNPAGPHVRLEFSFSKPGYMEWVTLEGSDTGRDWKFLARGKLFMLSNVERLQMASLDYPPAAYAYLRLTLPLPPGESLPRLSDIRVLYQEGFETSGWELDGIPVIPLEEPLASVMSEPGFKAYRLDLPPGIYPSGALDLPLNVPHPPVQAALWKISGGLPQKLYSCTLWPQVRTLTLPRGKLETPAILVLEGPAIDHVFVYQRRDDVYFYAAAAGTVTLAYGGVEKRSRPTLPLPAEKAAQAEPDAPQTRLFVLSPELLPLSAAKPATLEHSDQTWELNLPSGAEPGLWVQLPISDELSEAARGNPQGFGIVSGDRNVAVFLQTLPEPRLIAKEILHLKSQPAFPNQSEAEFAWSGAHRQVSFLALASPLKSLRCTLMLSQKHPHPEKHPLGTPEPPEWSSMDRWEWTCGPWDSACGILIPLQVWGIDRLKITLDKEEPSGPDTLEASLWQRRYRLVFPIPSSGAAMLTWSANRMPAPGRLAEYIRPELLPEKLPLAAAGAGAAAPTPDKRWETVLFYGALILAAAVLLVLIVRLLPKRES